MSWNGCNRAGSVSTGFLSPLPLVLFFFRGGSFASSPRPPAARFLSILAPLAMVFVRSYARDLLLLWSFVRALVSRANSRMQRFVFLYLFGFLCGGEDTWVRVEFVRGFFPPHLTKKSSFSLFCTGLLEGKGEGKSKGKKDGHEHPTTRPNGQPR